MKTVKPGKQRKRRFNAKKHEKDRFMHARLSDELRKTTGKKALAVRKDDKAKIMHGEHYGKTGKVLRVNRDKEQVFIEKILRKKSDGKEILIPLHPSNLIIIELKQDGRRVKKGKAKKGKIEAKEKEKPEAKTEQK